MATTVSSAWTKPGAWALDSEEQEVMDAIQKQQSNDSLDSTHQQQLSEFPSLSDVATSKPSRKKKSQTTLSLAEFATGKPVSHGSAKTASKGLTHEELVHLPTGPRERTAEELERSSSRLGGGFQSYGSSGPRGRFSNGDDSGSASRWGSNSRVSNDEPSRTGFNRDSAPSRADEIDDWGAAKKSAPPPAFERKERGGFFDSQSRADESDSWVSNKSHMPSESRRVGSGFEGFREKKGGFEMFQKESANGSVDSDTWGKKREEGSGRPRLMLQPRTLPVSNEEQQQTGSITKSKGSNPFGEARPREEVLQPRTLPLSNEEQQQQQTGSITRSKGSNPFGEARPREEVLAEKGQDWKTIDGQLDSMKIKEMGPVLSEGSSFGKKSFGTGNWRASLPEDRIERPWRKADSADVVRRSENVDNGEAEN